MTETVATHETFGRSRWGARAVSLRMAPGEQIYAGLEPASIRADDFHKFGLWFAREAALDDGRIAGPLHVSVEMDETQAEDLMIRLWFNLKWCRGEWSAEWDGMTMEEWRAVFYLTTFVLEESDDRA